MEQKEKVIVICGPTASGKTALSIELAKKINGEIISADSMQIYKDMDIGTAKPTLEEMQGIKHYLLDFVSPNERYSVAQYKKDAKKAIKEILQKGKTPIIVGGTGLYVDSLIYEIEYNDIKLDMNYRKELEEIAEQKGLEILYNKALEIDPKAMEKISKNDKKRILRVLEIYKATGKTKTEQEIEKHIKELEEQKEEIQKMYDDEIVKLQQIASLTKEQAKEKLLQEVDKEVSAEKAEIIRNAARTAKEDSLKNAREVLTYAIQKCAADHSQETTVSIVALPSDDMKGRIIGREGRNIKALETLTGVDLIIDDTPEAVVLSGFDPLRREVAKITLEKLIDDGRIHPAKIEETVEKAKQELAETIKSEGERAVLETGVIGLHPDLVKLIGKLKYRTSYGQNVLNHSIEVSNLARIMAEELGLDAKLARRAGLLHDIGKALDHDMEGTHVEIGVEILKKYKENPLVINAVEAHHEDVEPQTLEAVLIQAADAISASRPGARRETLEAYIKRLQNLEEIADSFDGVEKSFAIQAGREVRIIVKPDKVSDDQMTVLARNVSKRVENEMDYPGQIKVNVIRETRVVDYAK